MNFECIKKLHPLAPCLHYSTAGHISMQGTSILAALLSVFIEDVLEKLIGVILLTAHNTLCY